MSQRRHDSCIARLSCSALEPEVLSSTASALTLLNSAVRRTKNHGWCAAPESFHAREDHCESANLTPSADLIDTILNVSQSFLLFQGHTCSQPYERANAT